MTAIVLVVKDHGEGPKLASRAGRFGALAHARGVSTNRARGVDGRMDAGMTRQRRVFTASTEVSGPERTWSPSVKLNPAAAMCSRDVLPRCPAAGMCFS
jgi:hypothetical protein